MIILIIVKWKTFYLDTNDAPSIISMMINMFLNFGQIKGSHLVMTKSFNESLHKFLLFIAFFCIPAMLLLKPLLIRRQKLKDAKQVSHSLLKKKEFQKFENEEYKSDEEIQHSGSDEGANSVHDVMDMRF